MRSDSILYLLNLSVLELVIGKSSTLEHRNVKTGEAAKQPILTPPAASSRKKVYIFLKLRISSQ